MAALTVGATLLGDALLVPVTEVGSLAVGVGWLSTCLAFWARGRRSGQRRAGTAAAIAGAAVSIAIIAMKVLPFVPGSFTRAEWIPFGLWSALGLLFWSLRTRKSADRSGPPSISPVRG
jgi:peptidoglycan biosynthesis protein MviN/MurJ (putative lipid II flippase)